MVKGQRVPSNLPNAERAVAKQSSTSNEGTVTVLKLSAKSTTMLQLVPSCCACGTVTNNNRRALQCDKCDGNVLTV